MQASVCLLLGLFLVTPWIARAHSIPAGEIAKQCYKQFRISWIFIWLAWGPMYVNKGLALSRYLDAFLDTATSAACLWAFLVLDKPSVATQLDPRRARPFIISFSFVIGFSFVIFVSRVAFEGLVSDLVSGLYGAVALAFLVGRFDSHWLAVPRFALVPLYLYAIMQPIPCMLPSNLSLSVTVAISAIFLLLKVHLWFIVERLISQGKLAAFLSAGEAGLLGPADSSGGLDDTI
jgi:hypothetical protein